MEKITTYVKPEVVGSYPYYTTILKACVKVKRTVMVLDRDYSDCYTAINAADRVAKSLGYNHKRVESFKNIWSKV
ncbi:hypothetical protein VPH184E373B_0051 [Vibrio phage 184E37-3b]|nr:hypothetical protein MYOV056v2_p0044 [Vibrio phage 184E37.3a]QZI90010.1 hypothetical protein MYOV057v1_p0095 [Vibrio phage 184E37.1]